MNRIPVCYCGNKPFFGGIFMSVLSVIKYTEQPLHVILLTMDVSERNEKWLSFTEEQRLLLEKTIQKKNPDSIVEIIDVSHLQREFFEGGKNQKNSYTPYASIRLFLDILDVPDKIVYLDADVMCCSDISEHYNIDISDYEFAATLDVVGHHFFPKRYCNSGVLLLNMKKIRETGLFDKARRLVRSRPMLMPDQSALNIKADSKLVLPYRFNEQRSIKPDTVYKHFCMGYKRNGLLLKRYNYKQWHRDKVHNELGIYLFDDIYEQFDFILNEGENASLIKM